VPCAPFIAAASPVFFGSRRLIEFDKEYLESKFANAEYAAWTRFRESEDSRFVGLTFPGVVGRSPYHTVPLRDASLSFTERIGDADDVLRTNAAFTFAVCLTNAFVKFGWFGPGNELSEEATSELQIASEAIGPFGRTTRTEITDAIESWLSVQGFISLFRKWNCEGAVFPTAYSCQVFRRYPERELRTDDLRIDRALAATFCGCRFALCIKAMARDLNSCLKDREHYERWLYEWINTFVCRDFEKATPGARARRPLRGASIILRAGKDKPREYWLLPCIAPLRDFERCNFSIKWPMLEVAYRGTIEP
jgi:type VI secretion system ImpC/EvpB family protein